MKSYAFMKIVAILLMFLSLQCLGQKHKLTYFIEGKTETVFLIDPLDPRETVFTNKFSDVENCFTRLNQKKEVEIPRLESDTVLLTSKRRLIERSSKRFPMSESGIHEAKICLDPLGNIVSMKLVKSPSKSKSYNKEVLLSMFKYRFATDYNAPCMECGLMRIITSITSK